MVYLKLLSSTRWCKVPAMTKQKLNEDRWAKVFPRRSNVQQRRWCTFPTWRSPDIKATRRDVKLPKERGDQEEQKSTSYPTRNNYSKSLYEVQSLMQVYDWIVYPLKAHVIDAYQFNLRRPAAQQRSNDDSAVSPYDDAKSCYYDQSQMPMMQARRRWFKLQY